MSAIGAMAFEGDRRHICDSIVLMPLDKCLPLYAVEESLEHLGIWLTLVAMLGQLSNLAPTPKPRVKLLLCVLPVLWILQLFHQPLVAIIPRFELQLFAQPASVAFESGVHLHGYRIDKEDEALILSLYQSARRRDYAGLGARIGFSVHLIDQVSGDSVASQNQFAGELQDTMLFIPGYSPIYRQKIVVQVPSRYPTNRAFWVVLTLWREKKGGFEYQDIHSSDNHVLGDTQVVLGEWVIPLSSVGSPSIPLAVFGKGFTLDAVTLPETARAGETLTIDFGWRSDIQGSEDHVQFMHFVHVESGQWWGYDQQPLGPRLPTRLWYSGLADNESWQVPLPADLAPGLYSVFTGLYRTRDQERIPANDADGTPWLDARVALGDLVIEG